MTQLSLPLINPSEAPEPVRSTLTTLAEKYGFLPNLYRVFAHAPPALNAYLAVSDCFTSGSLSATERNIILLTASRENGCRYCVAVHSTVADMQRDAPEITEAIRKGQSIDDPKLEALRKLTEALVRGRGHAEAEISAFIEAGYKQPQVLEVLVGIMMKTLSNYTNHLAETPLDEAFSARAWSQD